MCITGKIISFVMCAAGRAEDNAKCLGQQITYPSTRSLKTLKNCANIIRKPIMSATRQNAQCLCLRTAFNSLNIT